MREARRAHELDAIETLISRLEDYRAKLRFKQVSDFEELKVCEAVIDLFDDGDVSGRRDAILEENRWSEDGNPVRTESDLPCPVDEMISYFMGQRS